MRIPRRRPSLTVAMIAALLILAASGARGDEIKIPWKIDAKTALTITVLAIGHGIQSDDFAFTSPKELAVMPPIGDPPFFEFYGLSAPTSNGSFGYFFVNPWTGEVWASWGCYKLTSRGARKIQTRIRKRFTAAALKQYAELSRLKPECIVELP